MLVLIDESGCAGFKLARGSSPYFVVVMVIFKSNKVAEATSTAIEDLRKQLDLKTEFKFSKLSNNYRDSFFKEMQKFDFKVRALVVDKTKIYSQHLRTDKNSFYSYFVKMLMQHGHDVLDHASIKIDGSGDKDFKRELQAYLLKELPANKIKKFRFIDSKSDNLIQLADMVVGAIARSYKDKDESCRWKNMLRGKIEDIWNFGK